MGEDHFVEQEWKKVAAMERREQAFPPMPEELHSTGARRGCVAAKDSAAAKASTGRSSVAKAKEAKAGPPESAPVPEAPVRRTARMVRDQLGHAKALKEAGSTAFERRDFKNALEMWHEAARVALEAGDSELWTAALSNVTLAMLKREDFAGVEVLTSQLLDANPRHEKALYRRGVARQKRGNLAGAQEDLRRALAVNSTNVDAQKACARVEKQLSDLEEGT
eukprot:gnl/TRDRNA2_/TRDRNA2_85870_c0_seq2.p1 gnl/TRDRNA2_/TRDRNA2_85870_c0~~gnl/TRDRNA2_/TRDRNA2_85870_c0_seq2.p1  ORF type:complete len:222 (+),score=57.84 gnl/TRDRNA2_/TRDRNA2_85870_c0_seq2:88-753(+)